MQNLYYYLILHMIHPSNVPFGFSIMSPIYHLWKQWSIHTFFTIKRFGYLWLEITVNIYCQIIFGSFNNLSLLTLKWFTFQKIYPLKPSIVIKVKCNFNNIIGTWYIKLNLGTPMMNACALFWGKLSHWWVVWKGGHFLPWFIFGKFK